MRNAAYMRAISLSVVCLFGLVSIAAGQTSLMIIAGPNTSASPILDPIWVDWNTSTESWDFEATLVFEMSAGPIEKNFESPQNSGGGPILLDAQQPLPQLLSEDFQLPISITPRPEAITDWHEEILTPGWEWVIPGDSRFPNLFPDTPGGAPASLITKNGEPWPWQHLTTAPPAFPNQLAVEFPPIKAYDGEVLDIHKAMLWVGTPGNQVWGDNQDDSGAYLSETAINVMEYPTGVPEPSSVGLLCVAVLGMMLRSRM